MPSEADLERFAEHVIYEIEMLLASDDLVLRSELGRRFSGKFHPTLHNALLQSHTVHVRNLYGFFFFDRSRFAEDAFASHYVPDWPAHRPAASAMLSNAPSKVDVEIVHLSYGRLRGKTAWTPWKLTNELVDVVETWLPLAPEYFQAPIVQLLEAHRKRRGPFKFE